MHPFIRQHQSAIAELCRRYRVQRLEVFGSAAGGTDFSQESSDADFLVVFSPSADSPTLKAFLGYKLTCRKFWGAL
jgi:predicted nucleotidyltransferase